MNYPIGQYECKLDNKGRLMMPSDCKEQFGGAAEEGFVLRPGLFDTCLELYTLADWKLMQEKLAGLNPFVRSNVNLLRKYNAGAVLVKLDATGRLQLSKLLLEKGGLKKDIVLTSVTSKMEIWDKEAYENKLNDMDDGAFEESATSILGNINFE